MEIERLDLLFLLAFAGRVGNPASIIWGVWDEKKDVTDSVPGPGCQGTETVTSRFGPDFGEAGLPSTQAAQAGG
ncbi:MAG: hypothetical protein OXH50_06915 [Gemmatimonadetes bacterium]|nr:hypothetical protein [Gemmatimonadota bacterium]